MKRIATTNAPAALGPYAQAVDTGDTVYCSGQLGLDPATGALAEGVQAQTTRRSRICRLCCRRPV